MAAGGAVINKEEGTGKRGHMVMRTHFGLINMNSVKKTT